MELAKLNLRKNEAMKNETKAVNLSLAVDRRLDQTALLLAVLAYPKAKQKLLKFHSALLSKYWVERTARDVEWASSPQLVPPIYLIQNRERASRLSDEGMRVIWSKRFIAGSFMEHLLSRDVREFARDVGTAEEFEDPTSSSYIVGKIFEYEERRTENWAQSFEDNFDPEFGQRFSVNWFAAVYAQKLNSRPVSDGFGGKGGWTRDTVLRRIWSPSKPVIHIAMAIDEVWRKEDLKRNFDFLRMLEGDWLEAAVEKAKSRKSEIQNAVSRPKGRRGRTLKFNTQQLVTINLKSR